MWMYYWPRITVITYLKLHKMQNMYFQVNNFNFPVFIPKWNVFDVTVMGWRVWIKRRLSLTKTYIFLYLHFFYTFHNVNIVWFTYEMGKVHTETQTVTNATNWNYGLYRFLPNPFNSLLYGMETLIFPLFRHSK